MMNDKVTALLRTVVPALWGTFMAWLIGAVALPDSISGPLSSDATVVFLVSLSIGAWYALWNWLQPRLPDWLVRILMGAAAQPSYGAGAVEPYKSRVNRCCM